MAKGRFVCTPRAPCPCPTPTQHIAAGDVPSPVRAAPSVRLTSCAIRGGRGQGPRSWLPFAPWVQGGAGMGWMWYRPRGRRGGGGASWGLGEEWGERAVTGSPFLGFGLRCGATRSGQQQQQPETRVGRAPGVIARLLCLLGLTSPSELNAAGGASVEPPCQCLQAIPN
jgi:hypothetical protein